MLHSTDTATPWTDSLQLGLTAELGNDSRSIQVYLGSPDKDEDHFDMRFEEIRNQFGEAAPFAVITDGEAAFAFMRKYREDLFSDVPVIFCGIDRPTPEYLRQCGKCTGIPMSLHVRETVELIFRLHPQTGTVVGIMDGSPESMELKRSAEAAMEPYLDRASILFPGHEPGDDAGLDMSLIDTVANSVPRRGAVLFLGFRRDNSGEEIDEGSVVKLLTEKSAAPVFGLTDQWMGTGMLGGVMVQGQAQGVATARIIRRIAAGESIREMLPETVLATPVIDLTVLTRFGVQTDRLPPNTLYLNAPLRPDEPTGVTSTGLAATLVGFLTIAACILLFRKRSRDPQDRGSER